MVAENPYTAPTIAGYNASPPPDDGSTTSANQVEWAKHKEKLGDPIKTLAEADVSATSSAFSQLVLTTDPGQETVIVMADMFGA